MPDTSSYRVSDYGDTLEPGERLKIEHKVSTPNPAIAGLVSQTAEALEKLRGESANKERVIYSKLREAFKEWEKQATETQRLGKAIQYVKTKAVEHTSNRWTKDEYNWYRMSNAVYRMYYRIVENKWRDLAAKKDITTSWELSWGVYVQDPGDTRTAGKIAGQDRKRFADKAAMDKYLQGRIKAYAHLFTEISPPIPKEYAGRFTVNGQLLPGYTVESEQEKQSVLDQLAKAKTQAQERFRKGDDYTQPPHLSPWGELTACKTLCPGVFQVKSAERSGIMVADEVTAILSPYTCKQGERRGGFLCFEEEAAVIQELSDKKLLNAQQAVAVSPERSSQTIPHRATMER